MTRPFSPLDLFRLRALQPTGTALEVESEILVGHSPLRHALIRSSRLTNGRTLTLVLTPRAAGGTEGFVQCRMRASCATEADLTYVAPSLTAVEGAALSWQRLIAGACQHLGALGVERVFASASEDDRVALQVLRQLGFSVWTNDVVFVRDGHAELPVMQEPLALADPSADVDQRVRSLVHDQQPHAARSESPEFGGDWAAEPGGGYAPGPRRYKVWIGDAGEVKGAYRLVCGARGVWIRAVMQPGPDAQRLVGTALADASAEARRGGRNVYAAARGYEPELNLALRELGFEPVQRRFHLIKHTTARILAPSWRDKRVRDAALRRAPTSSAQSPMASAGQPPQAIRHDAR